MNEGGQEVYRALHSTETALLKVHNNIMEALHDGQVAVFVMLELLRGFDTRDHDTRLNRLLIDHIRDTGKGLRWTCRTRARRQLSLFQEIR